MDETRNMWDSARFSATCFLQPYSKKQLLPTDIASFPWDEKKSVNTKKSTRERFEEIRKRVENL